MLLFCFIVLHWEPLKKKSQANLSWQYHVCPEWLEREGKIRNRDQTVHLLSSHLWMRLWICEECAVLLEPMKDLKQLEYLKIYFHMVLLAFSNHPKWKKPKHLVERSTNKIHINALKNSANEVKDSSEFSCTSITKWWQSVSGGRTSALTPMWMEKKDGAFTYTFWKFSSSLGSSSPFNSFPKIKCS